MSIKKCNICNSFYIFDRDLNEFLLIENNLVTKPAHECCVKSYKSIRKKIKTKPQDVKVKSSSNYRTCKKCNTNKLRIKPNPAKYRYIDETGKKWVGLTCSDCYSNARYKKTVYSKSCNYCHAEFITKISTKKYCSFKCKKSPIKSTIYIRSCKTCSNMFISKVHSKYFCSKFCTPRYITKSKLKIS